MDSATAKKQIDQMIAFIEQEAKEKAEEIRVKYEAEYVAEKLSLTQEASAAIREEYEKKRKDRVITKRIERSKALNNARYQSMRRRDDKMKALKDEVTHKLEEVSSSPKYRDLLRLLIVQGCLALQEKTVTVKCRAVDQKLVEPLLAEAVTIFQDTCHKASGVKPSLTLTLASDHLAVAPSQAKGGPSCCGGIELLARGGKIRCSNTLDSRLDIAFRDLEPQIRGILFGVRPKPIVKQEQKSHGHH